MDSDFKNKVVADSFMGNLIFGIFALILGIVAIVNPGDAWFILCVLLGIALLLKGIMLLFPMFKGNKLESKDLIVAVVYIIVGLILIFASALATTVLMYLFGALILIYGLMQLYDMLPALKSGAKGNVAVSAIIAIIAIILGILIILNPGATADIIMILVGVILLIIGILNLVSAFQLKGIIKTKDKKDEKKDKN